MRRIISGILIFSSTQKNELLYIVPNINNEGGVARILSLKMNYFIHDAVMKFIF
jgi:hypothetical protein